MFHTFIYLAISVLCTNGKDDLGKFDVKTNKAFFIRHSSISKVYWVYNNRTLLTEESIYVVFD